MIHLLRWLAILGVCGFFGWIQQSHPHRTAYRKRTQRAIEFNGRASGVRVRSAGR